MKLVQKHIYEPLTKSFTIRKKVLPCFAEYWHFHEKYELIWLVKGKEKRFFDDHIAEFTDDELVLTGPNLTHL